MESEHDRGSQIPKFLLSCGECVYLCVCIYICVLCTYINMHMYVFILVESKM